MLWKSCPDLWTQVFLDDCRTGEKATISYLVNSSVEGTNFESSNLENKGLAFPKFMFKRCCLLKLTTLLNFHGVTTRVWCVLRRDPLGSPTALLSK